jgi:hypothetical protein
MALVWLDEAEPEAEEVVRYTSHGHKLRFFESLKPEGQQ